MNKASILAASLLLLSGVLTVAQTSLPKMTVVSVGDGWLVSFLENRDSADDSSSDRS